MPTTIHKTATKNAKLPAGNADILHCSNGCLYIVGWAVFDEHKFAPTKVLIRPEGRPDIEVPVATQHRVDVNDYLGISTDIIAGLSILLSLSRFTVEDLPAGTIKVIFANPNNPADEIIAGEVDIQWPEQMLSVTPEMQVKPKKELQYKPPSFFKKLWRGELGSDPAIAPLITNASGLSAQAVLDAVELVRERPKLALSIQNSDSIRVARDMDAASKNRGLIVMFDHNFGGGANTYSKELVTEHLLGNNEVLRIWFQLDQTQFRAAYITQKDVVEFDVGDINQVFRLCTQFPSFAVQVNSLWGYPHIRDVLDNLVRLKLYEYTERMEYFAHDHIGICPSLFLLNAKHDYCGVPKSKATCTRCLKDSTQEFKVFFQETDVGAWRANWQSFFLNCDAMRFFSNSTLKHYMRAHPWLEDHPNTIVEGHKVEDIRTNKVKPTDPNREDFNIGVFGFINFHKGSQIVNDIAARIEETGDKAKVYVFGALDGASYGSHGPIELMGSYLPKDMAQHCDESNIDLAIVPSICPETFSITTKELTLTGIPVVTFDLGAQEELAGNYEKGHVLSLKSKLPVYDRLKKIKESF